MATYAYDETGAVFNYFLLTILGMVLIPMTYSSITGGARKPTARSDCKCQKCHDKRIRLAATKRKDQPLISMRFILLSLGWILLAFVAYKVATTATEEKRVFDPYAILGLDHGASEQEIESAYRGLVKKWHPDRNPVEKKEEANTRTTEINQARKTLTDPVSRKNWEEWGHPDGKQSFELGLALPKWLVEENNSFKVLLVYAGVFMVLLPALVARWWNRAKAMTKDSIMHETMARFYREQKENTSLKQMLELLSKAEEFVTLITLDPKDIPALDILTEQVKEVMANTTSDRWTKKGGFSTDARTALQQKVYLLLVAHMLRITPEVSKLAEEQRTVVAKVVQLVPGMLQITTSHHWLMPSLGVIDIAQMVTQALYPHQSPLLQLPFITAEHVRKYFSNKKRDVSTISDLLRLDEKARGDLLRFLEPEQQDLLMNVALQYPILRLTRAKFTVLGEPAIIPGALVTLFVSLNLGTLEDLRKDTERGTSIQDDGAGIEEEEEKQKTWDQKEALPPVHAPYFPEDRKASWIVYLRVANQNRLVTWTRVSDLIKDKTIKIQFQAPPRPGAYDFNLFIKSDSHLGCDVVAQLRLMVQPPEAAPVQDDDDEISDPEEDSIAGQMEAMRGAKTGKPAGTKRPNKPVANGTTTAASDGSDSDGDQEVPEKRIDDYEDSEDSEDEE
ncbi:Sec63 Brl domain-containing protein [Gaertneriomyces semiglobifer]|nr:Sec63 Brl domain-containing protein [Gaertneriomyces semiglobifer]